MAFEKSDDIKNPIEVKSSNIKTVGHDGARNILQVEFISGHIYQFHPVTHEAFTDMLKADSVGNYFSTNIRNNTSIEYLQLL